MEELKILQKVYDMILYAEECCLNQYPKYQKFVMASSVRQQMYLLMELCIAANKKYFKKTTMQEMDVTLSILRHYIRLSKDLGYLPFMKYENWSKMLDEIGRMLGGWMKAMSQGKPGA